MKNPKTFLGTICFLLVIGIACKKSSSDPVTEIPTEEVPKDIKVFYVGHSLSDYIPEMLKSLSAQEEKTTVSFGYQAIPGSPLSYNYNEITRKEYTDIPGCFRFAFTRTDNGLASGQYTHLVLTESVPRHTSSIEDTYTSVDDFYNYAKQYNPDIRTYFYEVWHCINSGTPTGCDYDRNSNPFRQRLTDDLPMWKGVVDQFNEKHKPKYPMKLIPGGQAVAMLYDEIAAGRVPGVTTINDVFEDDIHGNNILRYLVSCVHYAVLLQESPEGLSSNLTSCWGGVFPDLPLSAALTAKLQSIAKSVVCNQEASNALCR